MAIPTGTVTFLFTDIEGSTKLAQQYSDAMPALLARHHEILNQSIQAHNGFVFQIVGDSFSAAFHSASDALYAAVEAQRVLHQEAWSPVPIKVRMGIHTGTAHPIHNSLQTGYSEYATLALTQRIMSAGHGGQILLSGATYKLVLNTLPEDYDLLDLGERRLKDLLRPEHIYQLTAPGLSSTFPRLKTLDAFPNNLPVQLTTFVGREKEITEIKQALNDHRLITLTGSGGTGKTRVCLQVAADLIDHFDHGVWFVELAPLSHPELIPQTILSVIGISNQPGKTSMERLQEYLRKKKLLIILDNCEHLIEASAKVTNELLNAAPDLKILASSREALGVQGELSYPIPSLSMPDINHLPDIEQLSQYEAVQLFLDRARLVDPHFSLDKNNAPFIAQICTRLDGIPLAIELAAARIKMMSVEQISARLDDRFRLLTGGARTALPHQQTLRAMIDWSYNLLSENQRLLLRRLSVFAGSWTLEATEEVCVGDEIESYEILDLLTQLINKSLVLVEEQSQSRETRYRMLETIREYAASHLQSDPQDDFRTHELHSNYYAAQLEQWGEKIASPRQMETLAEMDAEIDNMRLAWNWMVTHRQIANIQKSLRSLWRFHDIRGRFQDGLVLMRQAATVLQTLEETEADRDAEHSIVLGRVLAQQGYFCAYLGQYEEAHEVFQQSLTLLRARADRAALAFTLVVLGYMKTRLGEFKEARQHVEESLSLNRALGDHDLMVYCLVTLSYIYLSQGAYQKAYQLSSEGLTICRDILGDPLATEHCLLSLSAAASYLGQYTEAKRWAEESLQIGKTLNHRSGIGDSLRWLGLINHKLGETERAEELLRQSISQFREIGDRTLIADALIELGAVRRDLGAESQAKQYLLEALRTALETQTNHTAVQALLEIAALETREGDKELALELVTYCLQHSFTTREVTDRAESTRAELVTQLTPQQIKAAEARAQAKTLENLAQETLAAS
jgi:predicted ATPase/class 3 adenylate cyclase